MKFTLEEIRMANMLIFPEDFKSMHQAFFGYPAVLYSKYELWWFIKEYCWQDDEYTRFAEYMVSKVLAKNLV